jgi:hypothetical protein
MVETAIDEGTADENVNVNAVWVVIVDTYPGYPARNVKVVAAVADPGTIGPAAVTPVTATDDAPDAIDAYDPDITVAAPGEIPVMALTGMSRPGFSVVPAVLEVTVTLTLLVDDPAGYVPLTEVTDETAVPVLIVEFKYVDVSDVSPLITWDPTVAVMYPPSWNVDERLTAQSV